MNLFKNRPLALFCLIFIFVSVSVYSFSSNATITVACVLLACTAVCLAVAIFRADKRVKAVFMLFCFLFASFAAISQWAIVDLRREKAESFVGEDTIRFTVIAEEYSSRHSSEYRVRIEDIGGDSVSLPSSVVMSFPSEYRTGDELYARAVIYSAGEEIMGFSRRESENVYIRAAVLDRGDIALVSSEKVSLEIIFERLRGYVSEYMDSLFGENTSILAKAFLLGDKSDMPPEILRDFRRAGVSHLLAVSGLHISVIIGALELILRKLGISKRIRCVLLSISALLFLAMTGFSLSACRAVLMLMSVYFCYLFVKENDSVTSLFLSVATIMLIFPHSVKDVGLWLSFLATLGIVALYLPVSAYFSKPPKRGARGVAWKLTRRILLAILLTFICNAFICAIIWAVFGELSLMALVSNLVLAPLSEIFIMLVPIAAFIGRVPVLGAVSVKILALVGKAIELLCGWLSGAQGAVISLRYPFAGIIIMLMSVGIIVVLIIDLKRKWLALIPPLSACLAFVLCLGVYAIIHRAEVSVSCYSAGNNEMLVLGEGGSAAVCDLSSGAYSFVRSSSYIASDNMATEISEYILTHYHNRQTASLDKLFRSAIIRRVYLPYPESAEEHAIAEEILECAAEQGVEAEIYRYGSQITILRGAYISVIASENSFGDSHPAISAVVKSGGELLSYINVASASADGFDSLISDSEYVIFGSHGVGNPEAFSFGKDSADVRGFYYTDAEVYVYSRVPHRLDKVYVPREGESVFGFVLG